MPIARTVLVLAGCSVLLTAEPLPSLDLAVTKIADLIRTHYVFEDRGRQIAESLLEDYRAGRFSGSKTWTEFAEAATKRLQEVSKDGHLYVRHDPAVVRDQLAEAAGAAAEKEGAGEDPFYYGASAREGNYGFREVRVVDGNIGYIKLSEINISRASLTTLFAALDFVAFTKALVLDLRDNGGGGSDIGPVIESLFLPPNRLLLEFRNRSGVVDQSRTVSWLTRPIYSKPLFLLVNGKTGSAAEALAFALQSQRRAVVLGQRSAGAAHMNSWYVVNADVYVSVSTGAPTLPGSTVTWEGVGVKPDRVLKEGESWAEAVSSTISH